LKRWNNGNVFYGNPDTEVGMASQRRKTITDISSVILAMSANVAKLSSRKQISNLEIKHRSVDA